MNETKLKDALEELRRTGWGHEGPDTKHLRNVLEMVIEALLDSPPKRRN